MNEVAHVALLEVTVHLPQGNSLKDKRSVIKGAVAALHRKFNVSAAEVGHLNSIHFCTLAITAVSNSAGHTNSVLSSAQTYLESLPELEVQSVHLDLL